MNLLKFFAKDPHHMEPKKSLNKAVKGNKMGLCNDVIFLGNVQGHMYIVHMYDLGNGYTLVVNVMCGILVYLFSY